MAFSHVALATNDLSATHRFYTEAMGFTLVHVEGAPTDSPPGWLRHAFYDTGDGSLLAFVELHDERFVDIDAAMSRGLGLPTWVNHLAFDAADDRALDDALERWLECGYDVVKMEHTHGRSIYAEDPNGNTIEWSYLGTPFSPDERAGAEARLRQPDLPIDAPSNLEFVSATSRTAATASTP
jgi:catechol 2,3-dioxygenase-like lactoylglutathione lyase family enzyme